MRQHQDDRADGCSWLRLEVHSSRRDAGRSNPQPRRRGSWYDNLNTGLGCDGANPQRRGDPNADSDIASNLNANSNQHRKRNTHRNAHANRDAYHYRKRNAYANRDKHTNTDANAY